MVGRWGKGEGWWEGVGSRGEGKKERRKQRRVMKYRRRENTIEGQRERDGGERERNRGRYSKFPRGQQGRSRHSVSGSVLP